MARVSSRRWSSPSSPSIDPETGQGAGYEFVNNVSGGRIPREYIPSVDQGGQDAMEFGVLAGYPMVDVKFTLEDGAYHDVDSSELAFKIAGNQAFKEAARMAKPVLLEPMFAVEVITPETFLGTVIGDINSRRGQIQSQEERHGDMVINALVPLSEMFGYVGDLRSKTSGQASYSMEFDSYAEVPAGHRRRDHQEGPRRVVANQVPRTGRGHLAGSSALQQNQRVK